MNENKRFATLEVTEEELEACLKTIEKMREEKQLQIDIEKWRERMDRATGFMVDDIGRDNARTIMADIERQLRREQ